MKKLWWCFVLCTVMAGCSQKPPDAFSVHWEKYVSRFYTNGRIIDTGNNQVSHSEGQGYGMLFAVAAGDKPRFDALWRWTQRTLQRRDGLFSWRYTPCEANNRQCVDDNNNASDGDILIAWALLRASHAWDNTTYKQQALTIIHAVQSKLIRQHYGYTVLLPGEQGFEKPRRVQLNLSYWLFPAFADFQQLTGDPVWSQLLHDGERLLAQTALVGKGLASDWLWLSEQGLSARDSISTHYGYNACRIPLHLIWQQTSDASLLSPYLAFWQQDKVPATVDVITAKPADYTWSKGMQVVAELVQFKAGKSAAPPSFALGNEQDYFSASLILLSELAMMDTRQDG